MPLLNSLRKHSLFQQILLVGLIPMLLMFISLFSYSLAARLNDAEQSQREIGRRVAENIAALAELALISGDQQQIKDLLPSVLSEDIISITVSQVDSNQQWRVVNKKRFDEKSEMAFANIYQRSVLMEDAITGETLNNGKPKLLGSVAVEQSNLELRRLQQQIFLVSSSIAILVIIISIGLAWRISRRLASPLDDINAATRDIANGRTGVRINNVQSGELGELQKHINNMSASLDEQQLAIKTHVSQLELAKAEAEGANRAKSLFLATMTHELRTPMNGALGMLQLLEETSLNQEQSHYVAVARDSSELLLGIVNDILDFSKIEKGELEIINDFFNIDELLEKTVNALRYEANSKGIGLKLNIETTLNEIQLLGDETRLRQVLLNLSSNAVKFTENGQVTLGIACKEKTSKQLLVEISIEDTGIGISPNQQKVIFDSFRQADNSTIRRYGGSGLGLAIVKRLCELMNISLQLNSNVGSGSTFTLQWHCEYRTKRPLKTVKPAVNNSLVGLSALVVEDNPVNLMLVSRVLEKWGIQVTTANHGGEALAVLAHHMPDVVLMDLQMPVMDGFETCQKIRQNPDLALLPIIALTANTLQEDKDRALRCGMNDYLSKPVSLPLLKEKLLNCLGKN